MDTLDSLNIRKGLELDVDVADIFAIKTSPTGEILAKEICELGWEMYYTINPDSSQKIIDSGGMIYNSEKKAIKISESLVAYVYDSYLVDTNFETEAGGPDVFTNISKEIEFLNTEILDFDQFCVNIMEAQSFTGKYKTSIFKFAFYGYGDFSMNDFIEVHKMVYLSNMHTINFYIKHKNVVSGISCFLNGLHRSDIIKQREYLTSQEITSLLDEADTQFEIFTSILTQSTNK